jgi:hypothetical protein
VTAKPTPEGLDSKGAQLWADIAGTYDLRFDEARILEDACREVGLIEGMRAELDAVVEGNGWLVMGSMKQEVAHPLVGELRQHRALLANLLGKLKLPDAEGGDAIDRSAAGRAMANARWGKSS